MPEEIKTLFTHEGRQFIADLLPGPWGYSEKGFFQCDKLLTDKEAFNLVSERLKTALAHCDADEELFERVLEKTSHSTIGRTHGTIQIRRAALAVTRKKEGRQRGVVG